MFLDTLVRLRFARDKARWCILVCDDHVVLLELADDVLDEYGRRFLCLDVVAPYVPKPKEVGERD